MIKNDEKLICCLPNQLAKLKLAVDAIAKVDKLKLKAVFFLELMVEDLQIQTDEVWIPLHIDNRDISLTSVLAVTEHDSQDPMSLSKRPITVYGIFWGESKT